MGMCGLLVTQETANPTELANCAIIKRKKKNNKNEIIMKIITMWSLACPTHVNVNLINDYLIML